MAIWATNEMRENAVLGSASTRSLLIWNNLLGVAD
jgi:hypothetical protein